MELIRHGRKIAVNQFQMAKLPLCRLDLRNANMTMVKFPSVVRLIRLAESANGETTPPKKKTAKRERNTEESTKKEKKKKLKATIAKPKRLSYIRL
jgi:hypothetical protein